MAYLDALAKRVDAATGTLALPTGRAEAAEIGKVLRAIDQARAAGTGRRR